MIDLTTSNYTITTTEPYRLAEAGQLMTPALLIYPEIVDANIRAMIAVLGGDTDRWRPHIKTSKLEFVMRRLVDHGIINFKCATTLELITACNAGARDILIAYPVVGANARRVAEIIDQHPSIHFSVLVENDAQVDLWRGRSIGIFIDINPGMNRTGISQQNIEGIVGLARRIRDHGLRLEGLHYYDGHTGGLELGDRDAVAHRGYDQLMVIIDRLEAEGFNLPEVISAGTPSLPCALSYAGSVSAASLTASRRGRSSTPTTPASPSCRGSMVCGRRHWFSRRSSATRRTGSSPVTPVTKRSRPTPGFQPAPSSAIPTGSRENQAKSTSRSRFRRASPCRQSVT